MTSLGLQTPPLALGYLLLLVIFGGVFLLIRGTNGSYVLSVSVLPIIGKMQKFPIIDFPYKYIKRLVFHELFFFFT